MSLFISGFEYACNASALVIQAPFLAAQLQSLYFGTQRKRNPALIAGKHFQKSEIGVWRWLYATKKSMPDPSQTELCRILKSIETSAGEEGTKQLWELSEKIQGTICALAKIIVSSPTFLETRGIAVTPGSTFYLFEKIYLLPNPVNVGSFLKSTKGKVRFADRYLKFGVHVCSSLLEELRVQCNPECAWIMKTHSPV
jgi:hypothetical protein